MEANDLQIKDIFRGMIFGVANIIPGVSGGTLALVLGIYERLIDAIHKISWQTIKACLGLLRFNRAGWEGFKRELARIDGMFLIAIQLGAMISIVALAKVMTWLLEHFHDPTYGFFWGLVLVSAWVPLKLIKKHNAVSVVMAMLAIVLVIGLSWAVSDEAKINKAETKYELQLEKEQAGATNAREKLDHSPGQLMYMVLVGILGISAMILPGISGSFILLLLGVYFTVLKSIIYLDLVIIAAFSIGNIIGILLFSRFLNFALKHWYDATMSFLFGLVVGSLVAIWPFKSSTVIGNELIYLSNRWPSALGVNEFMTVLTGVIGAAVVAVFIKLEHKNKTKSV